MLDNRSNIFLFLTSMMMKSNSLDNVQLKRISILLLNAMGEFDKSDGLFQAH